MTVATVSIIIPCYNKQAYVRAAIDSALAQTHACEIIVINDGSTDGSLEEAKRFSDRIHLVSGPNRGGSAARNRGLQIATGDWIQFLDADDILPKDKIAVQIAALKGASREAVAFCPWFYFHDDGAVDQPDARRYWHSYRNGADLLVDMWHNGGFFPPHSWLVPRSLIDKVGHWDETLTGDDDGEFFGRVLLSASELRFCEDTHVLYRDPPEGSVSRNKSLQSALSFWAAFEQISEGILAQRADTFARRACLARVRTTAYAWQGVPEILERAHIWERAQGGFDLSPALPTKTRWLVAFLGLKRGLALRRTLSGWRASTKRFN